MQYTEEQVEDIKKREKEVIEFLKKSELSANAQLSLVNMGDDVFGIKVNIGLTDLKYREKQEDKSKEEKIKEVVEAEVRELPK